MLIQVTSICGRVFDVDAKEVGAKIDSHCHREQMLLRKIADAARNLVPILKDHNLTNTAMELNELLFELDAMHQDLQALIKENPDATVEAFMEKLKKL